MVPYVAICCPILTYVALCYPLLPFVLLCCPMLPYVALCCAMLPYVALCCPMLRHVALCCAMLLYVALCFASCPMLRYVALRCAMLPYVVLCCAMLPYVALCCPMLRYVALWCVHLHLHNLFAKSYNDFKQIPVESAGIEMNKHMWESKVINNCGIMCSCFSSVKKFSLWESLKIFLVAVNYTSLAFVSLYLCKLFVYFNWPLWWPHLWKFN